MPVNSSKQSPCWKLKFDEQDRICWRTKALIGYKLTAPISPGLSATRVVLSLDQRDQHILLGTLEVFETDLNADQNLLVFDGINSWQPLEILLPFPFDGTHGACALKILKKWVQNIAGVGLSGAVLVWCVWWCGVSHCYIYIYIE